MINDFFINKILIKKRSSTVSYEDGIMKESFKEDCDEVSCRVSHLNYKDLALIQGIDDVQRIVKKLYVSSDINISPKDYVEWEGKNYQVLSEYKPQDKVGIHHKKYFIKLVE